MQRLGRLTTEDRDNLAAYLDGELDDESTRRIEEILTNNTVARNDVEALARTYEFLDDLPRPKAPEDFAEKTVATAKLEGYRKPITEENWYRRGKEYLVLTVWTAFLVATASVGYALSHHWYSTPQDVLIDELQVIKNMDVYSEFNNDVQFLEQLSGQPSLLQDMREGAKHE